MIWIKTSTSINARYAVMIDETLGTSAHREVTIHFAKETVLGDEILLYTDAEKADPKAADYADGGTSQRMWTGNFRTHRSCLRAW